MKVHYKYPTIILKSGVLYKLRNGLEVEIKPYLNGMGYLNFHISEVGDKVLLHRILMEFEYGELPKDKVVDHIDGNKLNNNLSNLRLISQSENLKNNAKVRKTGLPVGIILHSKKGTYQVSKIVNREVIHIGNYRTLEKAIQAKELFDEKGIKMEVEKTRPNRGRNAEKNTDS